MKQANADLIRRTRENESGPGVSALARCVFVEFGLAVGLDQTACLLMGAVGTGADTPGWPWAMFPFGTLIAATGDGRA